MKSLPSNLTLLENFRYLLLTYTECNFQREPYHTRLGIFFLKPIIYVITPLSFFYDRMYYSDIDSSFHLLVWTWISVYWGYCFSSCCRWQKTNRYILGINTSHCQNYVNWFKLPQLPCHHRQGWGQGWACLAEYEQDRLLIQATQRQRQILQSPSLACALPNASTSTQTSIFHHHQHTQTARHDRWEKTQRSAVSRASLRQDSGSFTSPWLRRWSWPKPIFSTVVAL